MKNKIIVLNLFIVLLVALSFSVLAIINGMTTDKSVRLGDKTKYEIGVKLEEGWNLITDGTPDLMQNRNYAVDSDIRSDNIKVIYGYDTKNEREVLISPNGDNFKIQAWSATFAQNENVFSSAFWVYSDKAGYLRYAPDEYILDLNQRQLFAGWNFVALTPEFTGKRFGTLKGTCDVIKTYLYNNEITPSHPTPNWLEIPDTGSFTKGTEGKGIIVKVSGDCKLGSTTSSMQELPILPN